jgi:hypothetical protein
MGACLTGVLIGLLKRHGFWMLVVMVWVAAVMSARWERSFPFSLIFVVLNFEFVKRNQIKPAFFEYVNTGLLVLLMYFPVSNLVVFELRWRPFGRQIALLVEVAIILVVNWRYRLISLSAIARFLLVATAVGFLFQLWQDAYVPRNSVKGYSLPLVIYYRWMMPVEMALIAAPFLFSALAGDIATIRRHVANRPTADAYYSYAIPMIAFGLTPGVGRGFHTYCEYISSHIAISSVIALIAGSFALALVFDRKSILIAAASTAVLLRLNPCVWAPLPVIVVAVAIAMLLSWRRLPKYHPRAL